MQEGSEHLEIIHLSFLVVSPHSGAVFGSHYFLS